MMNRYQSLHSRKNGRATAIALSLREREIDHQVRATIVLAALMAAGCAAVLLSAFLRIA